jgi:hypothetical protein
MKAKWMDKEAKVWFIEQNGSIKMDSTSPPRGSLCMSSCTKMSLTSVVDLLPPPMPTIMFPHSPELYEVLSSFDTSLYMPFSVGTTYKLVWKLTCSVF